jgi:acyl-CoA reductase-like NAD-dependent aldehyde dehydrogenase
LWEEGQPPRAPGDQGQLVSQALSFELRGKNGRLQVVNPATGERLLTPAEVHAARRTEAEARQVEAAARQAAEARAALAEAEPRRLQEELARRQGETRT